MTQKLNGVIIYIDNGIKDEDVPVKLIKSFETSHVFYKSSTTLIDKEFVKQNSNIIKLVIIDWALWDESQTDPSGLPEKERKKLELAHEKQEKANIDFITCCLSNCVPVVIFTKHDEAEITSKLIKYELIADKVEEQPLLQISHKRSDIAEILNEWYSKIPSVELFNIAQSCILEANREFFSDLIISKNAWISSLWDSFCAEHEFKKGGGYSVNKFEYALVFKDFIGHIISCIKNRINIDDALVNESIIKMIESVSGNGEDAKRILESINYIDAAKISKSIMPGDVFNNDKSYYINIRAECDTVRLKDQKVTVYLLKGQEIPEEQFISKNVCSICLEEHDKGASFLGNYYQLMYNDVNFTIPYICKGKILRFMFKDMISAEYNATNQTVSINGKSFTRIGRVLPPYSLKLQQRYSQYFSRIGLNAIPKIIVESKH